MLTQVLPHPPDSGPKVKTAAVLRYLAERHEVTLISFSRGDQADDLRHLRRVCREVHTVPIRRGVPRDVWYLGRSLIGGQPFLMARDARPAMFRAVRQRMASGGFDVVHADQLNMAQYARLVPPGTARVLDAHNALWLVTERLAKTLPPSPRRLVLRREARLLRDYEGRACREFEGVLAVSDEDLHALRSAAGTAIENAAVVPISIDVGAVAPLERRAGGERLLYIGSLIWPPSLDGLWWFLDEVLPRIRASRPSVGLDVVGADPPAQLRARAERDAGIRVHGYVRDPSPLLAAAAAMVVPLRAGGGMRVRILNGLAQGVPILTTAIGAEGIALENGRHALLADRAEDFAAAALRLLDDRDCGAALAAAGRRLVEERYDARRVCPAIEPLYERAVASARS